MRFSKEHFIERHAGGDRALLVHIEFSDLDTPTYSIAECEALARSAGASVQDIIVVPRRRVDSKYFIGEGKAQEIATYLREAPVDIVLVNHNMAPTQERNLEALWKKRIVDRTTLILDIFAQRARTFEGKLQVELAQLRHLSTRLVRGWTHLERQKGGIGLRGPGETQLETDRRGLTDRIRMIRQRLDKVLKQREQNRQARQKAQIPTVSLVGYTNAGKSTLFNILTDSTAYVADQLFATLDPTLRRMLFPGVGEAILVDTVGFIQDLPPELVAAFRATLEETVQSDLLVHVMDAHAEDRTLYKDSVLEVLDNLDIVDRPILEVMNKIDKPGYGVPRLERDVNGLPSRVWLSATTGVGVDLLQEAMGELLSGGMLTRRVRLSVNEQKLRSRLYDMQAVVSDNALDDGGHQLVLKIGQHQFDRLFPAEDQLG